VLLRSKQLEYSFRLTARRHYQDFRWVTDRYNRLPAFLDALPALSGVRRPGTFANRHPPSLRFS
jgi:hypothetical protein